MKNTERIIVLITQGNQYIRCSRRIRVRLTGLCMRLADRPGLDPDHVDAVLSLLCQQLEHKDWTVGEYDRLDRVWRSTKANRLPYELVEYDQLSPQERRTRLYDALRPQKGAPLDVIAIMKEAARNEGIELSGFCERHNIDLTSRQVNAKVPMSNSGVASSDGEAALSEQILEIVTAIGNALINMGERLEAELGEIRAILLNSNQNGPTAKEGIDPTR